MTFEIFAAFIAGLFIALVTWLITNLANKTEPKLLTIDDLVMPKLLPLFKNHIIERSVNVNDTHIIMSWKHDDCSAQREYKIHTLTSKEDFIKAWQKHEVDFYLRNVSVFGKSKYKKRAKT